MAADATDASRLERTALASLVTSPAVPVAPAGNRDLTAAVGRGMRRLFCSAFLGACFLTPTDGVAQDRLLQLPEDTFADRPAEILVMRAWEGLPDDGEGLSSYEARMTERMRVGVSVGPSITGRGRTLYHRERVARVWWSEDERIVKWLGQRSGQPAVGNRMLQGGLFGERLDIERELDLDDIRAPIPFDPTGDRLDVLDADFIHPVSTLGLSVYRFSSGDTLRITLPQPGHFVELVEVLVEPRVQAWETVTGALWFDSETGRLARATFRPSGVWDHEEQEPGDLDDMPSILRPAIGRVDHIVLDYGLYEQRWWLPRKLTAEGVFEWGRGLVRMPLQIEWTVADYEIDADPTAAMEPGDADRVSRRGRTTAYYPPRDVISNSPDLPEPLGAGDSGAFTDEELEPLLNRLDAATLSGRGESADPGLGQAWWWQVGAAFGYDRVRGASLGAQRSRQLTSRIAADLGLRLGTSELEPTAEVRLRSAVNADRRPSPNTPIMGLGRQVGRQPEGDPRSAPRLWLGAYNRLAEANDDWGAVSGVGNSWSALLTGHDDGEYYWSRGIELGLARGGPRAGLSIAAFGEQHRPADVSANFSLSTIGGGDLRATIPAERADLFGLRMAAGAQLGDDPERGVILADLRAEGAGGDFEYGRAVVTLEGTGPIAGRPAALRVSAGTSTEEAPLQRQFFLGGTSSLRGFAGGSAVGGSFLAARGEVGTTIALLRASVFADLAWTGDALALPDSRPFAAVGAGGSVFDGIFRIDLARAVSGGSDWRFHFYLNALI